MLADVTIDGRTEAQFRLAIEAMLREGGADEAARVLKSELAWLAGEDHPLPGQFRAISAEDLEVTGWHDLVQRIGELDSPGDPITAVGIDICGMQAGLGATPVLAFETTYYTDQAWGFSHADREGICSGYHGTTNAWQGAFEDIDDALRVAGLDDLNAVIAALEQHCHSGHATEEERRAFVVGACYLAVLIHQAVRDKARGEGLPRPMAVLVGSNEAYPWFEAPAVTAREGSGSRPATTEMGAPRSTIEQAMDRSDYASAIPSPIAFGQERTTPRRPLDLSRPPVETPLSELPPSDMSSNNMPRPLFEAERAPFAAPSPLQPAPVGPLSPPPAFAAYSDSDDDEEEEDIQDAPVPIQFPDLHQAQATDWPVEDAASTNVPEPDFADAPAVDPESDADAQDFAPLDRFRFAAPAAPAEDEEALHLPPPGIHVTGTQLRRRFVDRETVAIEEERKPGLVGGLVERLFRRR